MTRTLYDLTAEYQALLDMADDPDISLEAYLDTLEGMWGEVEEAADSTAKILREMKGRVEVIKAEEKRLEQRRKRLESFTERTEEALKNLLEKTGKTKFKTELFSFSVRNASSPKLVIDDPSKIPDAYMVPQPPKVDNASIKEALEVGIPLGFAHLEKSRYLSIR